MLLRQQIPQYFYLMRLHKPIGTMLLFWPTFWALWIASHGSPDSKLLVIFTLGIILMRSAGCVINDFADQHFDGYVLRTRNRPIAAGFVSNREALTLAIFLSASAFGLVLMCNNLTIYLAIVGAILAVAYPYMKRFTFFPQLGLGLAFTWGIPMAFAAQTGSVSRCAWFLYFTGMIWPIIYDTMYAMVDKEDDLKIGVKSTAILFNHMDKFIIALLQILFLAMLVIVGLMFRLHFYYYVGLFAAGLLFIYQQWLIYDRHPQKCFRAFINNNWVGFVIFVGIAASYISPHPEYLRGIYKLHKPELHQSIYENIER